MSSDIEVLPVTSAEAVRILGSLKIEELEHLLDDIAIMRKNVLLQKIIKLNRESHLLKAQLIVSR